MVFCHCILLLNVFSVLSTKILIIKVKNKYGTMMYPLTLLSSLLTVFLNLTWFFLQSNRNNFLINLHVLFRFRLTPALIRCL